jgi:hypothetical protein
LLMLTYMHRYITFHGSCMHAHNHAFGRVRIEERERETVKTEKRERGC